ncbi:phosphoribosylglycinamide formyltransferase [candidate division KSB1 bacterium]|nr:MAG: phosphoribosylglycinamide formyltransferase [candidate division KSB1 bacterium]MBC6949401.1 phosphoribosylglycinamide formyltransferase [candidate division KSB1 bacterium]MDL1874634.1 phosphoribosylglycinamide formyltransferase [Cytophagia bacterium CHB2]
MNLRLAVFASGRGSNFKAILDAIQSGTLDAKVVLLISDQPQAGALQTAAQAGIPTRIIAPNALATSEDYGKALLQALAECDSNFIVLAGFLRMIPAAVIKAFSGRIINIHPALLPSFGGKGMYGLRVHQAVLDYGCKVSGATVHLVDENYDTGKPLVQRCVPVYEDDTPESLAARVLKVEHQILPEALQLFAKDRVVIDDRGVRILT